MSKKHEEAKKKLLALTKPDPGKWKKDVEWRKQNPWLRKSQKIAFDILQALRAQKKTQKDLAAMMDVSPQQVNKWVKGRENFTLATLDGLEKTLGIKLLNQSEARQEKSTSLEIKENYRPAKSASVENIKAAVGGAKVIKLLPGEFIIPKKAG